MSKNEIIYEQLQKDFEPSEFLAAIYVISVFKKYDNTLWQESDVKDTNWWKNKYQELVNNIETTETP